jgi:hypothetical protein
MSSPIIAPNHIGDGVLWLLAFEALIFGVVGILGDASEPGFWH